VKRREAARIGVAGVKTAEWSSPSHIPLSEHHGYEQANYFRERPIEKRPTTASFSPAEQSGKLENRKSALTLKRP